MDKKRIAELRRQYNGIWSEHRHHHPFGCLAHSTLDIRECLDAIETLAARNAELEASAEDLSHAVRFLSKQEARTYQIRGEAIKFLAKEKCDEALDLIIMKWPIVQGLRNQMDIAKVGEQQCDLKRVRPAIDGLLVEAQP